MPCHCRSRVTYITRLTLLLLKYEIMHNYSTLALTNVTNIIIINIIILTSILPFHLQTLESAC